MFQAQIKSIQATKAQDQQVHKSNADTPQKNSDLLRQPAAGSRCFLNAQVRRFYDCATNTITLKMFARYNSATVDQSSSTLA